MSIDISTDLTIDLNVSDVSTPTINGVYDTGSPPDTYLPGKDFSATDDVSKGTTVTYLLDMAFNSLSHTSYMLDKVYIQSVGYLTENGTGIFQGYWINQNVNPQDITDDGHNTIIPDYSAFMSSIVFDSTANIASQSTLTTAITVTLPSALWWKSKIIPVIQVVAEKDGVKKVSGPLTLESIKLSTEGELLSTLSLNGSIVYKTSGTEKGIMIPAIITTDAESLSNVQPMLDLPQYTDITYNIALSAIFEGTVQSLSNQSFTFGTPSNATVDSFSYNSGILTITLKQTTAGNISVPFEIFIAYDAGSKSSIDISVTADWTTTSPVEISSFTNSYLFIEASTGSISENENIVIIPPVPSKDPTIVEVISADWENKNFSQHIEWRYYDCLKTMNSSFMFLLNSPFSNLADSLVVNYSYYVGETPYTKTLSNQSYTISFGYNNFTTSSDANTVGSQVFNGTIPTKSYQEIVADGYMPNIMVVTINSNLFEGIVVNTDYPIDLDFQGNLNSITQAEFATLYQNNPQSLYDSFLYSQCFFNTCYTSISEATTSLAGDLASCDSILAQNGLIYLKLGTTNTNQIVRFGQVSTVRAVYSIGTLQSNVSYQLVDSNNNVVTAISNYAEQYYLNMQYEYIVGTSNVDVTIPTNTEFSIGIPNELRAYLYISAHPYVSVVLSSSNTISVPIDNYILQGNQIKFTIPVELNFMPDSISIPVRFSIPSNTFTSSFTNVTASNALVYTQDANSLLYGFTTESKLFVVKYFTTSFVLEGIMMDTTGLAVYPNVYAPNETVTYMATVYNKSFSPSADYYMAITVPTNQYNPVTTSDNDILGFITSINPTNDLTVIYFQTASAATTQDIKMMKELNGASNPTLEEYYNTTIKTNWIKYTGQTLPDNVVMFVGYTPNVLKDSSIRINYNVQMKIPEYSHTIYTNNAVFNYFSTGSNLESQSNVVSIKNLLADKLPISKLPKEQTQDLQNNLPITFTATFTAPQNNLLYTDFTITDILPSGLTLDKNNCNVTVYPEITIPFVLDFDQSTNTAKFIIQNTGLVSDNTVKITIATRISDTTKILNDSTQGAPTLDNNVSLMINNDPYLTTTSPAARVTFTIPQPMKIPLTKKPNTQYPSLIKGNIINFTISFIAPAEQRVYHSFTISDIINPALVFKDATAVIAPNTQIPIDLTNQPDGEIIIKIENTNQIAGQKIIIFLSAILDDLSKLPENNTITNTASIYSNDDSNNANTSNTVSIIFQLPPSPRQQSINDLIHSVALEETALSHIINAEGEKIQKVLSLNGVSNSDIIAVNNSVKSTLDSIASLELVLQQKLGLIGDCSCPYNM